MTDRPQKDRRPAPSSRLSVQAAKRRKRLQRAIDFMEPLEERLLMTRLAVNGDLQSGSALQTESTMMKGWNPDAIISLGDNVHGEPTIDDTVGQYFHSYVSPYHGSYGAGSTTGNKFWSAVGNHDYEDHGISDYKNFFTFPGNEMYYSTQVGNIALFFVDSNPEQPDGNTSSSVQGQWLKNALAASTAQWKLVLFHFPAYTSGTEGDHTFMQWPFQQWGANAVLSAHDHMYERLSVGGLPYFVNGLGGSTIIPPQTVHSGSQVRYSNNFGAMEINSTDTSLNFQFINISGTVEDNFTLTAAASGPTTTLIAPGASWKYLDNGTNQGTAWRNLVFDDSSWASGPAQLGYGDGDESTVVGYGSNSNNKFVTTYFRRSFTLVDPSTITSLTMQLVRDDGAVVYLNGTEIYRNNMPSGTITSTTLASTAIGGTDESAWYASAIDPSLLVPGTNVIAVEMHQSDVDSTDLSFDFQLAAVGAQTVAPEAPSQVSAWTQSASQTNVSWTDNSSNETGFKIERSSDGVNYAQIGTAGSNAINFLDTSGTVAGVVYDYRVRATNASGDSSYSIAVAALTTPAHTIVVFEENEDVVNILGSSQAPYLNSLITGGAYFSDFHAITHPSQPNYIDFFSGSSQGVTTDDVPASQFSGPDLGSQLLTTGRTFVGYAENLPAVGSLAVTGGAINAQGNPVYARKHNPWSDFADIPSNLNQPLTSFPTDFNQLPTFAFVIPNLSNDMHDGTVAQGDAWLQANLGAYATWAKANNSLLVVTWDEDESGDSANVIPTIVYGQGVKTGTYNETVTHFSLLRTFEDMYGVSRLGSAAGAAPIQDSWSPVALISAPSGPSDLLATTASSSQINLTWTDTSNNESGFIIDRSPNGNTGWTTIASAIPANTTSYSATGLTAGTPYYFRVRATNSTGDSANSNTASATTTPLTSQTFIPAGSTWNYLDNGSNQGTAWQATGFNDSAWKSGPAQLGYGDGDEATVVSYGTNASNKYITTYFRKTFNVTNPAQISALNLQLLRDDGAVVYLNGTEVFRSNMPTGTISSTTLASTNVSDADESTFFPGTINPSLLVAGANVIAVEIHQSVVDSSDISFDFSLTGAIALAPTAPSLLTAVGVSTTQIKLAWQDNSSNETGFILERSPDGATGWLQVATPAANATTYTDTVTPGASYFYRIRATNSGSDSANTAVAHSWALAGIPSTPTPNGVLVNSLPATLDWADAPNATSYDVFLGSTLLGNVATSQYTGALPASADGILQWHVVAKNADNSTTGPTWSFTLDTVAPSAVYNNQAPAPATASLDFTVTYADLTAGLDSASLDDNDITVTGPHGFSANAIFIGLVGGIATYRLAAPGGTWDAVDDGLYTISQNANQVSDLAGNARLAGTLGMFDVNAFAYLSGSTLNVQFDGTGTPLTLTTSGENVLVTRGATTLTFSGVISIAAFGSAAADALQIDGALTPALTFSGATGEASVHVMAGSATLAGDLSALLHNVSVAVDAGASATFTAPQHLASLVVDGNATLAPGAGMVFTNALSVTGKLDLGSNALFLDYSGDSPLDAITTQILAARNGGTWTGNGITTSMSAAAGFSPLTSLGIADASDALGISGAQTALWNGQTVDATTLQIKYTYVGDANLDGTINGDDYFLIDAGYSAQASQASAYARGDFDFNGRIDADDYFLIDSHYEKATVALSAPLDVQRAMQSPEKSTGQSTAPSAPAVAIPPTANTATIFSATAIPSAYERLLESDELL